MKQIVILFAFLPLIANAQAWLDGDSIVVDAPIDSSALDYQIFIQNLDNIGESLYLWESNGKFKSPWCNVRVSRTMFDSLLVAHPEWAIDLKREPVAIEVWQKPGRKLKIETNLPIEAQVRNIAYGGAYSMMLGNQQIWPTAALPPGTHELFVPYRIAGWQVVTIKVGGSCQHVTGRLVFMN